MKMKNLITTAVAALGLSLSGSALADGSGAGIVGSPHDFSDGVTSNEVVLNEDWNQRNEICRVCHVPHDHGQADQRYLNGLLWNHEVSEASYTMYSNAWSSTLDGAQSAQPDGIAKLCLGCHDGTVAIDTFDKYAGGLVDMTQEGYDHYKVPQFTDGGNLDMRGSHPISITFDNVADTNLNDPTATAMGTSGMIEDVLDNGKVQCSSCHDVHDQESVAGTHLLRVAQTVADGGTASGLCLTCHIK